MNFNIKEFKSRAITLRDFIFELLFPIECLGCGRENFWLCPDCFNKIDFNNEQSCFFCKEKNETGSTCPECKKGYAIDGILIAGNYDNPLLSRLIKMLKYNFIKNIADDLANFILVFLNSRGKEISNFENKIFDACAKEKILIIPVPLHKRRLKWRGFNQSEEIAKIFSEKAGYFFNNKNLIRKKHGKEQAKLNEKERKENVKNCFMWAGNDLIGANIILVDDVATTGSTLEECAIVLKNHGAKKVWGLVLAKG